jgi:hypothetical protein
MIHVDERHEMGVVLNDGQPTADAHHPRSRTHMRGSIQAAIRASIVRQWPPPNDSRNQSWIALRHHPIRHTYLRGLIDSDE